MQASYFEKVETLMRQVAEIWVSKFFKMYPNKNAIRRNKERTIVKSYQNIQAVDRNILGMFRKRNPLISNDHCIPMKQ